MLRNITLMVASCLIAGSPLLAQEKTAPKKAPLPPPVVHQKEVKLTPPVVKKDLASSKEVSNPKGKMVKFKPPVVVKDEEVKTPPPPPPAPPVIKKDEVKVPPPPPPAPPKKKD
jgi:filamentous hemagglutinin